MATIDLSADVGELPGSEGRHLDDALIERTTTAHVAAGGHAGDDASIRAAVAACVAHGTQLGAHPSYPDREGFGRRRPDIELSALRTSLAEQIERVATHATAAGAAVRSVKPHGSLYGDLEEDDGVFEALVQSLAVLEERPRIVLAAGTRRRRALEDLGFLVTAEGFCDRRYGAHGRLVARSEPGSVLDDPADAADQAIDLVRNGLLVDGALVEVSSLCVHSDSPGVLGTIDAVIERLRRSGVELSAPT